MCSVNGKLLDQVSGLALAIPILLISGMPGIVKYPPSQPGFDLGNSWKVCHAEGGMGRVRIARCIALLVAVQRRHQSQIFGSESTHIGIHIGI